MASAVQSDRVSKATKPIAPTVRSWIKNCIVPILVREYLSTQNIQVVSGGDEVLEGDATSDTATRVGQ
jgi:hypothetical protein